MDRKNIEESKNKIQHSFKDKIEKDKENESILSKRNIKPKL